MRNGVVFSQAFQIRVRVRSVLEGAAAAGQQSATEIRGLADALDSISASIDFSLTAVTYSALADLLRIIAHLTEWRVGVLDAVSDVDRFLRAAKERCKLWSYEYRSSRGAEVFGTYVARIGDLNTIDGVTSLCSDLAATPLPIPFLAAEISPLSRIRGRVSEKEQAPPELTVAFLRFAIDGVPASETHFVQPVQVHDLDVEVRVSRWPAEATDLKLSPLSVEAADTFDLPSFHFSRPVGDAPYILRSGGRAVLKMTQAFHARPFEFKYAAEFHPTASEQPVAVVGHRTLRVECIDVAASPVTGYPGLDRKIIELRNSLRLNRIALDGDLGSLLTILAPLCNLAGRAIQDRLYATATTEARFQQDVKAELRRQPAIGVELDEHAHGAGGITDLSFRGIPIELKVENEKRLRLEDCVAYTDQVATYAVAKSKSIGVLCVLDCSKKVSSPLPAEQLLGILKTRSEESVVWIVTVVVQGNFPVPSDLSR